MICLKQKPSLKSLKEGKGEKQIVSSFPTPQVREEGSFWKQDCFLYFQSDEGFFPIVKSWFAKANVASKVEF